MTKVSTKKRGIFFSLDALIALFIIFFVLLFFFFSGEKLRLETEVQEDVLNVLSNFKVGDIDNAYVLSLIQDGTITDLDKSLLQQIGEFYLTDVSQARAFANAVFSEIDTTSNF